MIIKTIVNEDISNYKYPSMLIGFPCCTFKCDKESGVNMCQNSILATKPNIQISYDEIIKDYKKNSFTKAFVFGGLEPFDTYNDLIGLVKEIRKTINDDIVIYTGYREEEIKEEINELRQFNNIIMKFGRFIPYQEKHYDDVLGIKLASPNQYGIKLATSNQQIYKKGKDY